MSNTVLLNHINVLLYNNFNRTDKDLKFIQIKDLNKFYKDSEKYSSQDLSKALLEYFKAQGIDYPYFRIFGEKFTDINKLFFNIRNTKNYFINDSYDLGDQKDARFVLPLEFSLNTVKKYYLYDYDSETYMLGDILADYYIENSRLQCKRLYSKNTAIEEWYKYDETLLKTFETLVTRKTNLTVSNIKKQFQRLTQECSGEKSTFYVSLFKLLYDDPRNIKVLDASAGYGNRLLGAMAANIKEYLGIEPNKLSHNGFDEMINDLKKYCNKENKYQVLLGGLPDIKLSEEYEHEYFDICIISPPSFNSEIYSQDEDQSIIKYGNEEEWTIKFLYATLDRIWKTIKKEGYLIVQSILNKVINPYIYAYLSNASYAGVISVRTMAGRNKPMWIWKKTSVKFFDLPNKSTVYDQVKYNNKLNKPYYDKTRIAFITEEKNKWYVKNIPNIKELLNKYSYRGTIKTMNDDLTKYDFIVIASPWNYYLYYDTFVKMLEQNQKKLINPYKTLMWNINKKYLFDLEKWNIPIVPTKLATTNDKQIIKDCLEKWGKIVIKPTVGADSYKVFFVNSYDEAVSIIEDNFKDEFLIQKYMEQINDACYYLVMFNYKYSHHLVMQIVNKQGTLIYKNRIQINKGMPSKFITHCENILQIIKEQGYESVYARIDGIEVNGNFLLMELELIEPNLHFATSISSSNKYFESINDYILRNN
jgi:glutathione synthase/RimK-type ligase-like ATP-grasp enzyme/16S rRNA G966 N2-methylase RsmD